MSESPVIYVDLIEEQPQTRELYDRKRAYTSDRTDEKYAQYLAKFQPWRVVVKSGDNQKALFRSTERYFNRSDAIHAAELAFADRSNVYLREAEQGNRVLRMAVPL
jgi:hypothetical protein